jgi:hypothetical protein
MAFKYIVPSALLDSQYQGKTMKSINFAKIKSMQCFFLNILATPRKAEWKEFFSFDLFLILRLFTTANI